MNLKPDRRPIRKRTSPAPRRGWRLSRKPWLAAAAGFVMVLLSATVFASVLLAAHGGRALPGVYVADIDISGMDRDAAAQRLADRLPGTDGEVRLSVDKEHRTNIGLTDLGWHYEYETMLEQAFAHGRGDGIISEAISLLRGYVEPYQVSAALTRYDYRLEQVARSLSDELSMPATEAIVSLNSVGRYEVRQRSAAGSRLDTDVIASALRERLMSLELEDEYLAPSLSLASESVTPRFETAEALSVAQAANVASEDLSLTAGDDTYTLSHAQLAPVVDLERSADGYEVVLDQQALRLLLEQLSPQVTRQAADARYARGENGIVVNDGISARQLDLEASLTTILATLNQRLSAPAEASARAELAVTLTPPEFTKEEAEAALSQMQVISSWTTTFVPGPGNFNGLNISIPAEAIDGHIVLPGETFDFWDAIGEVSEATGYGPGGAIIDGRSSSDGALAGGICSTSTTLFNTAARGGFALGERLNHFYYIDRYPMGLDATVYQVDSVVQSMTFANDTSYPLIIRSYNAPGSVRFDIVSVPNGRKVAFSEPVVTSPVAADDVIEYSSELPEGTSQRVEWPHDGFQVTVERTVHDVNGELIHHNTYYSNYRAVDGVTLVGRS